MIEIDKEKIKKRFVEINEAISEIKRLTSIPDEIFWNKKEYIAAVKYHLLVAIEAIGSVCVHIAAKKFNKGISRFGECFEILSQENVLNTELTLKLQRMVKFRNRLMHRYWEIDDQKVLEYSRKDIGDLEEFIKTVSSLL